MRIVKNLLAAIAAAGICAACFLLPDAALALLDAASGRVTEQTVPGVTLNLTQQMPLYEKVALVQEHMWQVTATDARLADEEVRDRAMEFYKELLITAKPDTLPNGDLVILCTDAAIFFRPEDAMSATFWSIAFHCGSDWLVHLVIDDETGKVLALSFVDTDIGNAGYLSTRAQMQDLTVAVQRVLSQELESAEWKLTEITDTAEAESYDMFFCQYILHCKDEKSDYTFLMECFPHELRFCDFTFDAWTEEIG